MPKTKSKRKNTAAFRRGTPFSKQGLLIFALAFGLIGGFIIWKSFAASPGRWVYGMGMKDGSYLGSSAGWWSQGTSTGWVRLPNSRANNAHIDFLRDGSVDLMSGLSQSINGWFNTGTSAAPTVRLSLLPGDTADDGSTTPGHQQHVVLQAYDENQSPNGVNGSDVQQALFGSQPSFGATQGQEWYYGWVFSTNSGFTPSTTTTGWFNALHDFHVWFGVSTPGGNSPVGFAIATKGPAGATTGTIYTVRDNATFTLAQPHIGVNINGGNAEHPSDYATANDLSMYRIIGPVWQPGKKYAVAYHIKWDAYGHGLFEWWVNGVKYGSLTNIYTMWRNAANTLLDKPYPQWENYRGYDPALAGTENSIYYGALLKGSSLSDVTIPTSSGTPSPAPSPGPSPSPSPPGTSPGGGGGASTTAGGGSSGNGSSNGVPNSTPGASSAGSGDVSGNPSSPGGESTAGSNKSVSSHKNLMAFGFSLMVLAGVGYLIFKRFVKV